MPGSTFHQDEYFRSVKCKLLVAADNQICSPCSSDSVNIRYEHNRKEARLLLERKQLKTRLAELQESLETHSKPVDHQLNQDFIYLFSGCDQKDVPLFMKLFWDEQKKHLRSSTYSNLRYHPMIIKVSHLQLNLPQHILIILVLPTITDKIYWNVSIFLKFQDFCLHKAPPPSTTPDNVGKWSSIA